jgi:hypothetical protein
VAALKQSEVQQQELLQQQQQQQQQQQRQQQQQFARDGNSLIPSMSTAAYRSMEQVCSYRFAAIIQRQYLLPFRISHIAGTNLVHAPNACLCNLASSAPFDIQAPARLNFVVDAGDEAMVF